MSIASKLEKLTTDITNAYTSLSTKQATIPQDKNTENLKPTIDSIEVIVPQEAEGTNITLTQCKEISLKEFTLEGATQQGENPSPTNPQEINNVEGKNKFDKNAEVVQTGHISNYSYSNGTYTIIPTGTGNPQVKLKCKIPVGSYILNSNTSLSEATQLVDGNNTVLKNFWATYQNQSFTLEETSEYMVFNWGNPGNTNPITLDLNTLMISKDGGDYVPYNSIQVKKCNKNLADYSQTTNTGIIDDNGTIGTANTRLFSNMIKVNPSSQFHYKTTAKSSNNENIVNNRIIYYDENRNFLRRDYDYSLQSEFTFTIPNDVYYIVIDMRTQALTTNLVNTDLKDNTQLEQGSTATDYIEHQEQVYNFPLSEGQKLYQGSYLADDGIHNVRKQVVLDGSETGISTDGSTTNYKRFIIPKSDFENISNEAICSHFKYLLNYNEDTPHFYIGSTHLYFFLLQPNSTTQDFKTWLSTNKPIVEYKLAQEEIIPYTPEQEICYLKIIKEGTYNNITHYMSNGSINPNMVVTYYKKI